MDSFIKQLLKRIPRHGEGLLGVGAVHAAAVYLAVFFSEIISGFIPNGYSSLNHAVFNLVTGFDWTALISVAIFIIIWIFLGAIAFAGSTRYLMGCVDPEHIAQRTFAIGIKLYTRRMLSYTSFFALLVLAFMGMGGLIFETARKFGLGTFYILSLVSILGVIFIMVTSRIAYTPMFMIQGKPLGSAMGKSWAATKKRYWLINLIRLALVTFVMLPVILKYFLGVTIYVPSIEIWPYAALIVAGFEEIFVAIGFQEFEFEKKEPIVSKAFEQKDLQMLEVYTHSDDYADPGGSMEF